MHPVTAKSKIRKCSMEFRNVKYFCAYYRSNHFGLFP